MLYSFRTISSNNRPFEKFNIKKQPKYTYSVILLNWKRPKNIIQIISEIHKVSCINEIIVSNGHSKTILDLPQFSKVKCINDVANNDIHGLNLRFVRAKEAQNQKVIIMDDDILITPINILKVINIYEKNPNRIVGLEGRMINENTKNTYSNTNKCYCHIILTRFLICDKMLCTLFFKCMPLIEDIYKLGKPYGNGEDIVLSIIATIYYKQLNYQTNKVIHYINLPDPYSIHSTANHKEYRNLLCNILKKRIMHFNEIINRNK